MSRIFEGIGVMSGTSGDGVDIVSAKFEIQNSKWNYEIICVETIPYSNEWKNKLQSLHKKSAEEFAHLHSEYGHFLGREIKKFIRRNLTAVRQVKIRPQFVASHGHTIFHQPEKGFTSQFGNGASISSEINLSTVCDFRSNDVALGGQGAPLVPFGEKELFVKDKNKIHLFLNLGGIANISFHHKNKIIAYDICPCNMILNELASQANPKNKFDRNGRIAKNGRVNEKLLEQLDNLFYYKLRYPKSLSREWFEKNFHPLIQKSKISVADKLATVTEHIVQQIFLACKNFCKTDWQSVLFCTGGGAKNIFLMEKLDEKISSLGINREKVSEEIIDYKEALIFAFLGLCRLLGKNNILSSVTGAKSDNIGGAVYLPPDLKNSPPHRRGLKGW